MVKPGLSGDEGRVEQYDAVFPVPQIVRDELLRYFECYGSKLDLGPEAPLLPGEDISKGVSTNTLNDWWHRAELELHRRGESLGVSKGNAWHGFRITRRTEYRAVHDKYGRWLVGHSIHTGTPGISVSEGRYLGIVPEDLIKAIRVEGGAPEAEWDGL